MEINNFNWRLTVLFCWQLEICDSEIEIRQLTYKWARPSYIWRSGSLFGGRVAIRASFYLGPLQTYDLLMRKIEQIVR